MTAAICIAPYLPLTDEVTVGEWRLIPFEDFARRHAASQQRYNDARRLRTAYRVDPGGGALPLGAFAMPASTGVVGDAGTSELSVPLHRALVAALLDGSPSLLNLDFEPNAGHASCTAENASLVVQRVDGSSSHVVVTGAMVRRVDLVHAPPGRRLPRVPPPPELPTPLFGALDEEYASAVYDVLAAGGADARRLNRAIEWLGLAWSNNAAITEDARVLVFRAGFEVLLGGGASTEANRKLLSALLDEPGAATVPRTWLRRSKPVAMTDLQWWFQSFGLLRNAVAHGDELRDADWVFDDGHKHLAHADAVLKRAIKRTVVRAGGDPLLEVPVVQRYLRRAAVGALSRSTSSAMSPNDTGNG